ncbi:MAG: 2Fe-2S iron-sulfur cluster-binding protein, partial [Candidatus Marinimicrobia bacterium]|nr:2Fe-2S iron-sulfur cluster-binding protein [Candidatus Neomarinimicrobiota bacterium]
YEVTLKPSGKQFVVENETTVLDAAAQAKITLSHSCRDGSCGTCKSRLLKGQVDHPGDLDGISEDERAEGYILTCVAKPRSNVELESSYYPELDGIEPAIFPCKVENIDFPAQGIAILHLRLPPNSDFRHLPGQYIELMWKAVRRSYSIANAGYREHGIELHICRVANGVFSQFVFEELRLGTLLRLNGPHGTFFVRDGDAPIIFLAGGTGIAPVKAMVEQLLEQKSQRLINIYWGISSIDFLYTTLPNEWQKNHDNITFTPVLLNSDNEWRGRQGLVHQSVMADFPDLFPFEIYACGSPNMITAAKSDFLKRGLLERNFFADAFTPFKQTQ